MGIGFADALGIQPAALALRARRAEIIAGNLANADTPGYLARDIPFAEMLAGQQPGGRSASHSAGQSASPSGRLLLTQSSAMHLKPQSSDRDLGLQYRTPLQPAVDGNTVDSDQEMATFAQNSVAFEASFSFLNSRFRGLISAIRGD